MYNIAPDLIIEGLVCTSQFEDSQLWHRAVVTEIIDENYIKVNTVLQF